MIQSSTTGRPAGGDPAHVRKGADGKRGTPGASGTPDITSTSAPSIPPPAATRLKQRGRAAPPNPGRPGPAAQFLGRTAQESGALPSVIGVRFDDTTRTAIIALDSDQYFKDRLASAAGTLTPALMEELCDFARKMSLEGPDATTALVYSTFLDNADAPALTPHLVEPIFRSLVRGPAHFPPDRLGVAVRSICSLFPHCLLPDDWLRALLRAARAAWEAGESKGTAAMTSGILYAARAVLPDDERRAALDRTLLRLALEDCRQFPGQPIGLVTWMNGVAIRSQPRQVAEQVLEALRELPDLEPHPLASVMVTLGAGTVMPLATDGSAAAEPLNLILAWALKLPNSHRSQALAGIVQGMAQSDLPAQGGAAHLHTALRVVGELETEIRTAHAQGLVGAILSQVITAPGDDEATGRHRKAGESKSGPSRTARAAAVDSDAWPAQVLAGLRAVLVGVDLDAFALEHHLPMLGGALAGMAGGRDIAAPTLQALVSGLVQSPIATRHVSQLLVGLARGAGGDALREGAFAAFVQAIAQADEWRGATLACHFCGAIGAAGAHGRKLSVPIEERMAQAIAALPAQSPVRQQLPAGAGLPQSLALGCQLARAPLEAARNSPQPQAGQLQLLEAALDIPGGLGEALLAEQVFDCAVLAGEDLDFAFEAARHLTDQVHTQAGEPLLRQLRAALLGQVIALAQREGPSPAPGKELAKGLDNMARLYDRASRSLWIAQAEAELQVVLGETVREGKGQRTAAVRPDGPATFLASEAARMRSGPHAALLEPLAVKLESVGKALGTITVSSTLSASS